MSRQAALIAGAFVILLLLVCNLAVAAFALPRVFAFVREGNRPAVAQPNPTRPATQAQPPAVVNTATPAPRATVPQAAPRSTSQATPRPFEVTVVVPGGGPGVQGLPTATPGASPTLGPSPTPFPTVAPLSLSAQEQALAALYNRTRPGVVNVDVTVGGPGSEQPAVPQGQGSGSGFVWDKQGHIVTNSHVIANSSTVRVTLWDDTVAVAKIVGTDPDSDLAVIKIEVSADKLIPLEMGDSDQVRVGQTAIAMGNPFAVGTSMSLGIISAVGRSIPGLTVFQIPDAIQTDAPINPGNSGGPLMDAAGRVIGVNAQIRSEVRANSGVGFAIPVNIVKVVVPDLVTKGRHPWPWLGVSGRSVDQTIVEANNLKVSSGAYIDEVVTGGPSAKGGLRGSTGQTQVQGSAVRTGGDVITAIDGTTIRKFDDLLRHISMKVRVGQTVELTVLRDGQETKVRVTLEERPRSSMPTIPGRP
jgi:serine protease Do